MIGLNGDFQRKNAALAVASCAQWIQSHSPLLWNKIQPKALVPNEIPEKFKNGLAQCKLPGRAQIIGVYIYFFATCKHFFFSFSTLCSLFPFF